MVQSFSFMYSSKLMLHHRVIVLSGYSAYRKKRHEFSKNEQATFKWSQNAKVNVVNGS